MINLEIEADVVLETRTFINLVYFIYNFEITTYLLFHYTLIFFSKVCELCNVLIVKNSNEWV